jgi:hypothetical protein
VRGTPKMESKPKNLGWAYLVGKLQAQGLSRQAVLVVNVILERILTLQTIYACDPETYRC